MADDTYCPEASWRRVVDVSGRGRWWEGCGALELCGVTAPSRLIVWRVSESNATAGDDDACGSPRAGLEMVFYLLAPVWCYI